MFSDDLSCRIKKRYTHESAARLGGYDTITRNASDHKLWPYKCSSCDAWHLTSRPSNSIPITNRGPYDGR